MHPQAFGPTLLPRLFLHVRGNGDELWDHRFHGWDAIRRRPSVLGWRVNPGADEHEEAPGRSLSAQAFIAASSELTE